MAKKGRHINGHYGEKHTSARLTEHDVKLIMQLVDDLSLGDIADKFDVSKTAIYDIKHARSWKYLTAPLEN
jgi:predicted DNA-binding protein YlxM (UPF0122 family)